MSVTILNLLIFTLSYLFLESQGFEKLPVNRFEVIVITDNIIRKTTAKIFAELQLNIQSPRLKQALLVHNFFTSVSLKDDNTLNFIFEITRVDRFDNNTKHYTTALIEAVNEELNNINLNSPETNEDNIEQYIHEFITNLNKIKAGIDEGYENLDIKKEIIHILKSDDPWKFNPLSQKVTTNLYPKENANASNEEFWIPNDGTRRIYKGRRAKIKYFPFVASIHIFKAFQCAGSIIKSDLIVTAASCLQLAWNNRFFRENPAFLSVRVGSNFYHGGGEEIPILEVYFNPGYNPRNLRNNIAIIRLLRHLKFRRRSKKIKKIAIDVNDAALPVNTEGITILGWGARSSSNVVGDAWSNQLAFAVLDVYHFQECQEIYSREYITRTNFCAGFISKGGGACNVIGGIQPTETLFCDTKNISEAELHQGHVFVILSRDDEAIKHDVGGPGVVNGVLVGIISFGSPVCGTPDAPTVFTKVGFYADWIEEVMELEVPQRGQRTTLEYTQPFPDTPAPPHLANTRFTITPLVKPRTPIPLNVSDTLRIRLLENDQLFQEFLNTMFEGKDVSDFKALFLNKTSSENDKGLKEKPTQLPVNIEISEEDQNKEEKIHEKSNEEKQLHELDTKLGYHTVMGYLDSEEKESTEHLKKPHKFTVFDKDNDIKDVTIERNIVTLSNVVDKAETKDKTEAQEFEPTHKKEIGATELQDTSSDYELLEIEYTTEPMKVRHTKIMENENTKKPFKSKKKKVKQESKKKKAEQEDDIFTLLYMTDYDTNNGNLDDINNSIEYLDDDSSAGLPIESKSFTDLTHRTDNVTKLSDIANGSPKTSVLDLMSRSELYDLLSEAIDEVTNYENPG